MAALTSPAVGDDGTAVWAGQVADMLDNGAQLLLYTPIATLTTGAAGTDWIAMGNITVPTWATRARVRADFLASVPSGVNAQNGLAVKIGTVVGATKRMIFGNVGRTPSFGFWDLITGLSPGVQAVVIRVVTVTTGTFAVDTASEIDCAFDFLP
jgi:hypothetical protein